MKLRKYMMTVLLLLTVFLISGCLGRPVATSPIVAGKWNEGIFTNTWSNITFQLPAGFNVVTQATSVPQQVSDFTIANDDNSIIVSLTYIDVSSGDSRDYSAEDYLNMVKEQLAQNPNRTRTFQENFESMTIAGREYAVMRTTFFNNDNPTNVILQDGYAHRFHNTMILFLTIYPEDAKDFVESFLESIEQAQ